MHKDDAVAPDELSGPSIDQDPSTVFADQAYLTYCVPAETDVKLEAALKRIEDGENSIESIPQRDFLFFGMYPRLIEHKKDSVEEANAVGR